jgi:hypothetical protein
LKILEDRTLLSAALPIASGTPDTAALRANFRDCFKTAVKPYG